ncbi:MBL fold metallo-hydrolase [Phycisphaeraceae bacterium D3-23]
MRLQFLGANRQVTGSRYLLEANGLRVMIDCGMFQERAFLARNWEDCPVPPESIDCLLLTHAHLDHVGLIPRLVQQGFRGPIITVEPTVDLAEIIMLDAGKIQEEDAAYKKRRHKKEGRRGKYPEVPLYTAEDAEKAVPLFRGVRYGERVELSPQFTAIFQEAGHILGAASIELQVNENGQSRTIVFSGDVGQWSKPLITDPVQAPQADYVVLESTYGDRNHPSEEEVDKDLERIVRETARRGGNVVIPTFAMERAQELMYHLSTLVHQNRIPELKIFLDSPMAIDVTDVFKRYRHYFDEATRQLFEQGTPPLHFPGLHMTRKVEDSMAINYERMPCIILASSGMCTGGRIKHHLRQNIAREESTIVFVGYQANGTLGRQILNGDREVRIHGRLWPVRARIEQISGLSAHGDKDDLLRWLGGIGKTPSMIFLTHGEEKSSLALAQAIEDRYGWRTSVPNYKEVIELT